MHWIPILLLLLGIWWIFAGFSNLLPARHFRRAYQKAELEGKRFQADLTIDGFAVEGEMCGWHVRWPGLKVKGEDNLVFMFYSANTVFAFGKRFLDASQQDEVRRLSGIKSTGADISGR